MENTYGGAMYWTPAEFGKRLGLGAQTVREMCARREIPGAFRVGDTPRARWRIPREAEKAFVTGRQVAETVEPERVTNTNTEKMLAASVFERMLKGIETIETIRRLRDEVIHNRRRYEDVLAEVERLAASGEGRRVQARPRGERPPLRTEAGVG